MGVPPEPVAEFVAALREARTTFDTCRERVAAATVHDDAFGKLFEAHAVHEAYHQRLPEIARDFAAAGEVVDHFVAGLEGGHAIGQVTVPAQSNGASS